MGNTDKHDSTRSIRSVSNSLELIEALAKTGRGIGVTELSSRVSLSASSVHKHLQTLHEHGFVYKKNGKYYLGLKFLEIGGRIRGEYMGSTEIKSHLQELAHQTDRNSYFTVEERGRPIIIFREVGRKGVPLSARIGTQYYMHQIAGGKAILAEYPEDRVDEIIDQHGLPAATENSITDPDVLKEELTEIKDRGYAVTTAESTSGVQAIATAVTHPQEGVIGACALGGPVHQMNGQTEDLVHILQSTVNELELTIAYS